jgi:hypothetical protein
MTESSSAAGLPRPAWNKDRRPETATTWQMFNLAIDSKLRGGDLVALRVDDVAPHGYAKNRANIGQRKRGRPVRFELTEPTRGPLARSFED